MATVYANSGGKIIRFLRNRREEHRRPDPPPGTAQTLVFDDATNPAVIEAFGQDCGAFTMRGNQLYRHGQLVTLNPPGQRRTDLQAMRNLRQALNNPVPLTDQQIKKLFRILLNELGSDLD